MGLVVQAPIDVFLPALDTAAPGSNGAASGQAGDGLFASLLASLSKMTGPTLEGGDLSDTLVEASDIALGEEESQDGDKSELFAALFAMPAPVQLAGFIKQDAAGSKAMVETQTIEGIATAIPETALDLGGEEAAPVQPAADEAPAPAPAVTDAAPAAPAQPPTEALTAATQALSGVASDSAADPVGFAVVTDSLTRSRRPEARSEAPPADAAAPGAETATTEVTSVVRPVGNAETESEMGAGSQPQAREKDTVERPQPRASAQGIAHAAPNSAVGELRAATESAAMEAPASTESPAPAETVPQVEQVATAVIESVEAGGGEARIHLDPAGLGEVTIHVQTDGDAVRIDVRAERQEAANLLRDHTQDLSSLLGERGLNLSDVNVGLGRGNAEQAWGQDSRPENRPASGEFASILGLDEEPASIERHQRLRAAYNPDGAHLFRV